MVVVSLYTGIDCIGTGIVLLNCEHREFSLFLVRSGAFSSSIIFSYRALRYSLGLELPISANIPKPRIVSLNCKNIQFAPVVATEGYFVVHSRVEVVVLFSRCQRLFARSGVA